MGNNMSNLWRGGSRRSRNTSTCPEKIARDTGIAQVKITTEDSTFEDDTVLNDPDLMQFDRGIKQRTEKVLGSLENGMKSGGLELSALKEVTNGLLGMNDDVVKFILECDLDVWANSEMKELVTDYFNHSLEALDFCGVLDRSVQHARDNQMFIDLALRHMPADGDPSEEDCRQILKELDNFTRADNPFSTEFNELFNKVYDRQRLFQMKLTERWKRIQRKERNVRTMKKVTTVMITATCVSLVICAAVAMAVAAPAFSGGISAAAALPFDAMHGWLQGLWTRYEQKIKTERVVVEATQWGTWVAIRDLDTINTEVKRLKNEIEGLNRNIEFANERRDALAVQHAVRVIKRKQDQFVQQLEDLSGHVDECVRRIQRARAVVLDRIIGQSSRS